LVLLAVLAVARHGRLGRHQEGQSASATSTNLPSASTKDWPTVNTSVHAQLGPEQYRAFARKLRDFAELLPSGDKKQQALELAAEWERLADIAEVSRKK
jgi:hypothetical protein